MRGGASATLYLGSDRGVAWISRNSRRHQPRLSFKRLRCVAEPEGVFLDEPGVQIDLNELSHRKPVRLGRRSRPDPKPRSQTNKASGHGEVPDDGLADETGTYGADYHRLEASSALCESSKGRCSSICGT